MTKAKKYGMTQKCPRCGAGVHTDDVKRGKAFGNIGWPCGSTYWTKNSGFDTNGFYESKQCLQNQYDIISLKLKNAEQEIKELKGKLKGNNNE